MKSRAEVCARALFEIVGDEVDAPLTGPPGLDVMEELHVCLTKMFLLVGMQQERVKLMELDGQYTTVQRWLKTAETAAVNLEAGALTIQATISRFGY